MQCKVLSGIQTFKNTVAVIEAKRTTLNQQEIEDFSDQMQIMRTLEAEVYCLRLEWDKLLLVVEVRRHATCRISIEAQIIFQESGQTPGNLRTYEAIVDMLVGLCLKFPIPYKVINGDLPITKWAEQDCPVNGKCCLPSSLFHVLTAH